MPTIDWTPFAGTATWTFGPLPGHDAAPDDGPIGLIAVSSPTASSRHPQRSHQPLVEVHTADDGGRLPVGTRIGRNLRLVEHTDVDHTTTEGSLTLVQVDESTGVCATTVLTATAGTTAIRAVTTLSLRSGGTPQRLWSVTSLATGVLISDDPNQLDVFTGENAWASEHRWSSEPLRAAGLARTDPGARGETCRGSIQRFGTSSMSTLRWIPHGVATDRTTGASLAWQIEHNGGWSFDLGEAPIFSHGARVAEDEAVGRPLEDTSRDGVFLALSGPSDLLHQWSHHLDEAHPFTTVPATIAVAGSVDDALAELARHRRARRRVHSANDSLPIIFNDYMDTLEGDPTEAKLLPLIDAAAEVGADIFCIDAGWYDDTAGWWASVGDWEPSTARFPRGLGFVLDHIRNRGMVAGLWVEPEVVGVTSKAASALPDEAFMWRDGVRLVDNARHFLDLRSPAARAHLDATIDRLVTELGVGFFKFDHNCTPGAGTDRPGPDGESGPVGGHLLAHQRALLDWLDDVLDRHPGLVIESCASGAMRSDFAMLSRLHLQSTSDQQDPLLYPAIAVGALAHLLPEQSGNWAYPQATMTDDQIVFTMVTGLAGRVYQAGLIDRMDAQQKQLVADALRVHRQMLPDVARAVPRFPTGFPSWQDGWISVVLDAGDQRYLLVWRQAWAEATLSVPVVAAGVEQLYPAVGIGSEWTTEVTGSSIEISVAEPVASARVFTLD